MPRRRRSPSPLNEVTTWHGFRRVTPGTGPGFLEMSAIGMAARVQYCSATTAFTIRCAARRFTGHYDESVVLDNHSRLHPFLRMMVSHRPVSDRPFPLESEWIRARSSEVYDRLGLGPLQPCLYGLRHDGTSRSFAEVKKRGRSASD